MSTKDLIVVLDGATLNPGDLSWEELSQLGLTKIFPRSEPSEVVERSLGASAVLVNKVQMTREVLEQLPDLRCICVTATGYNNVDINAAQEMGIAVCNVRGYGTEAVAQHVFALLLDLCNQVQLHAQAVRDGEWCTSKDFSFWKTPISSLHGKTMGIFGFGKIGRKVSDIANSFGMRVIAVHKHPERDQNSKVTFVSQSELFASSDVISLNVPLTPETRGIINRDTLALMKPSAIVINTARGELVVEEDLAQALKSGGLAAAALDVLCHEPPHPSHPLLNVPNCTITPHQAWAALEARKRLMEISIENVRGFIRGDMPNRVV